MPNYSNLKVRNGLNDYGTMNTRWHDKNYVILKMEKNRESFKNLNKLSSRIIYWEHSSCSAISERWIWISPFCRVELKVTCKFWSAAWSFTDNAILFNLRTYLGTRQRFQIESRWFCKSPSRFSTAEGGFGQTYRQRHVVQISSFSKWLRQSFFGLQCPFVDT